MLALVVGPLHGLLSLSPSPSLASRAASSHSALATSLCKQKQIQILCLLLCYMFGNANQHPQIVVEGSRKETEGKGGGSRKEAAGRQEAGRLQVTRLRCQNGQML